MTLQEFYAATGGGYEDALGRLHSERLVQKFVLKFLNDDSYSLLCRSLEEKNMEEAFRAAHTLKGVCMNLGFDRLLHSSSMLTESLRNGVGENVPELFQQVQQDYEQIIAALKQFKEIQGL